MITILEILLPLIGLRKKTLNIICQEVMKLDVLLFWTTPYTGGVRKISAIYGCSKWRYLGRRRPIYEIPRIYLYNAGGKFYT